MNILVSNDDGLFCEGIISLLSALRAAGHRALAIAPDRNRSGASHSITFDQTMRLKEIAPDDWVYGGTPVDCVLSGLVSGGFGFKPDVVVSGINAGANLGTDIIYSGTAAAARQGSLFNLPSIAFSVDGNEPFQFEYAAQWSAEKLDILTALWRRGTFVNVNYPNSANFVEYEMTYPSLRIYDDIVIKEETQEGVFLSMPGSVISVRQERHPNEKQNPLSMSDWDAVLQNKVSVSLICNHPIAAA